VESRNSALHRKKKRFRNCEIVKEKIINKKKRPTEKNYVL